MKAAYKGSKSKVKSAYKDLTAYKGIQMKQSNAKVSLWALIQTIYILLSPLFLKKFYVMF